MDRTGITNRPLGPMRSRRLAIIPKLEAQRMNIAKRCLIGYVCAGIAVCGFVNPAQAQQSRLAPAEISQIVDEVLRVLVPPPGDTLGYHSKSKPFFDHKRTMVAFGYVDAPPLLDLRTSVATGSRNLLSDCDSWGRKPCTQLGWSLYVWVKPSSITSSQAVVHAYVAKAGRGHTPFVEGVVPTGNAYLNVSDHEIHLARDTNGKWKFVKEGNSIVGN